MDDPFEDALDDLRISGSVLLHERYAPPWSIEVPDEARLRGLLGLGREIRVVPFHLVRRNGFTLHMPARPALRVDYPELLICPAGIAHRMADGGPCASVRFEAILSGDGPVPADPADPAATQLVCGVFILRGTPLNPLLAALPPVLTLSCGGDGGNDAGQPALLADAADLLSAALSQGRRSGFTVRRLLEVLCAEAIGRYRDGAGAREAGWFRGLSDPRVGEAIRRLHADPARAWTVAALGREVGLSGSRLAARWRETAGVGVIEYLRSWRAALACRLLRDTALSADEIARQVGYEGAPAFGRAFRAAIGTTPGQWRRDTLRTGDDDGSVRRQSTG